jgi:signal transduction histidine kinase
MPTSPPEPSGAAEAVRSATASDASPTTFLHRLDHDLRTPLGTMAAAVDLLRDEPPHTQTHAEAIAVLERQIARLHALAQSLRDFVRASDQRRDDAQGG